MQPKPLGYTFPTSHDPVTLALGEGPIMELLDSHGNSLLTHHRITTEIHRMRSMDLLYFSEFQ